MDEVVAYYVGNPKSRVTSPADLRVIRKHTHEDECEACKEPLFITTSTFKLFKEMCLESGRRSVIVCPTCKASAPLGDQAVHVFPTNPELNRDIEKGRAESN